MPNPYTPPGVTVTELTQTSVTPTLASPADICLIGLPAASAAITTTDTLILSGTDPIVLPTINQIDNDASLVSVISVTNVLNPSVGSPPGTGYAEGTDYTFTVGSGPPDGEDGTISRVGAGTIPDNTLVAVTYTYTPIDYWNPVRLYDIASVATRFGNAWSADYSTINSPLTMAAQLAFANGAQSIICQPLFTLNEATPPVPIPAVGDAIGNAGTWANTLLPLRSIINLDIIVPVVGQDGEYVNDADMLGIFEEIQAHIAYQNSQELFIVGIFGEDGSASASEFNSQLPSNAGGSILWTHATDLQTNYGNTLSSQCVLVNNTLFQLPVPGFQGGTLNVGGQYCAAAVAGAIGGRPVSSSMTRQSISGFQSVTDPRTPSDKNNDASYGLFVVEQINGVIRCRQGITLDIEDGPARQELSVVRAKFLLIESIQQTLDNQIIGQIIADANSPLIVQSTITGVLALLQTAGTIVSYSPVTAQLSSITPTIITASFSYQPAFPLNFVQVTFALDLTTGSISSTSSPTS